MPSMINHRSMAMRSSNTAGISFTLNGELTTVVDPDPAVMLSDYIRNVANLKGTKVSCNQGGCGACTVVMSPMDAAQTGITSGATDGLTHRTINSCLRPLCSVDGMAITTVEGVGSQANLHVVQKQLVKHNGSQCGFCTPGMVMSMYGLLKEKPHPTAQEVEDQLDGNLCRCTGYRPILDAFQELSCESRCQSSAKNCSADIEELCITSGKCVKTGEKVQTATVTKPGAVLASANGVTWTKLATLAELYAVLNKYPAPGGVRMVCGNTASGVYPPAVASVLVDIAQIAELRAVTVDKTGVSVGGAVPIADLMKVLFENRELSGSFDPLISHMYRVANHQVRNVGSVSGNLMMTHVHPDFVSDMATILMAAGVTLSVTYAKSKGAEVTQVGVAQFFDMETAGLVILSVFLPALSSSERVITQKVAVRRVNAHALLNAAFKFDVDELRGVLKSAPTIVYGGVVHQPKRAFKTEAYLNGKSFLDNSVLQTALSILVSEMVCDPSLGRTAYRTSLVPAFLYKTLLTLWPPEKLPKALVSAALPYDRPISAGAISFDRGDPNIYPVTLPLPKLAEAMQTTGEAKYVDDYDYANTLHAVLVMSAQGNAAIADVDATSALKAPGVTAFISAKSLAEKGYCNQVSEHEELYISKRAAYCGQAIGMIVAETKHAAEAGAKLVGVKYADIQTPILTSEQAVAAGSLFPETKAVQMQGDANKALAEAPVVIEGETSIGHQYHFHLETQRTICVPQEDGGLHVYSSTQNPTQVQAVVATALNKPQNKVKVIIRRIGGAYGSKINRATPIAMACAVASDQLQRPVRLVLDMSTNMQNVGARSPYSIKYRIGATKEGKITAVQLRIYNNQGAHYDLDPPSTAGFFWFLDNVYNFAHWDAEIVCTKTNLPAMTYMRGPAYVESLFMMETMLEHVAEVLGLPPPLVREMNMYNKGEVTPFGQELHYCNAKFIFNELKVSSEYDARVAAIQQFNSENRWVKRGISIVPVRFGIYWAGAQFRAMVNVFPDGSISIAQSGCESGQGLLVKVAQTASMEFAKSVRGGCPMSLIRIEDVTTDVSNNVASTGGSITSELCAIAVQDACQLIAARMSDVASQLSKSSADGALPTWQQLVEAAVGAGVDLQAIGKVKPGQGPFGPFQYMSYGAGVTEAEVDILTGDTRLLRADLLLDCGKSMNPAIDIGQTQGAYVMGLGYFLSEEYLFDEKSGKLLSDSTWEYKPPSHKDIPHVFNTTLLQHSGNPAGFLRSKASGEPPYAMACSALLAVRQAVAAGASQRGNWGWVPLSSPATVDKVAMAAHIPVTLLRH